MNEITDLSVHHELISRYFQKYGFQPEHNLDYLKGLTDEGVPHFFYDDENHSFGIFCYTSIEGKKKIVTALTEPLAEDRLFAMEKFLHYYLVEKGFDKAVFESRYETKLALIERLQGKGFRVLKERYHLIWPIFYMNNFDENLGGGKWKKLRYFKNKFFKDNPAIVEDFKDSDKEGLKELVLGWVKQRTAHDRAYYKRYINFIESGFKGFEMAKVIKINDKPVSVFAGWRIPNSNNYYSCVGIYDYTVENIGEVSNVLDLAFIKARGFEKTDLGGGEEALTEFKKKFHPDEFYRSDLYSVVKDGPEKE